MPESLLILRHGAEILGVDLKDVREVTRMVMLRRLPGASAGVLGAVDLRGQIVPVLDLEARLPVGAKRPGADSFLVILALQDPELVVGVVASRIEDVESVASAAFQPAASTLPPGVPLTGMARTAQGWVPVLEPRSLIAPGEVLALREAVRRLTEHLAERASGRVG